MKIGIISDTHDNIENILKAVKVFNSRHVDIVPHAGDFVSPIAVKSFACIKLVGILGNNDTDIPGLTSAFNKINENSKETFLKQYMMALSLLFIMVPVLQKNNF